MDEPTTALDVVVQREILAQIVELQSKLHFAVLFITHDLSLLLEIADRIAVMYAGKLVELGSAETVHNQPAHPYTQGLLDSFPSVHGARKELAGIPGTPPDLQALPPGCPFVPRCRFATDACPGIDMGLRAVSGSDSNHVTACPFVTNESAQTNAGVAPAVAAAATIEATRMSPATARGLDTIGTPPATMPDARSRRPLPLAVRSSSKPARSRRTSGSRAACAAACCRPFAASRSASIAAPSSRSSARAAPASRPSRGCWPARSARRPARSCSTATRCSRDRTASSVPTRAACR